MFKEEWSKRLAGAWTLITFGNFGLHCQESFIIIIIEDGSTSDHLDGSRLSLSAQWKSRRQIG